jgi:hypothetical protein
LEQPTDASIVKVQEDLSQSHSRCKLTTPSMNQHLQTFFRLGVNNKFY